MGFLLIHTVEQDGVLDHLLRTGALQGTILGCQCQLSRMRVLLFLLCFPVHISSVVKHSVLRYHERAEQGLVRVHLFLVCVCVRVCVISVVSER